MKDATEMFVVDQKYGLIVPSSMEDKKNSVLKELFKSNYSKEEISEKIRLFYVALTRAREKMIVVLPDKPVMKFEKDNEGIINKIRRLKFTRLSELIYAVEEYMKPRLVGLEVTKELLPFVRDCMMYNSSPKAAVDIALYDLLSKSEGKTIYEYMGGKGEFCVKTDITISLGDVKTMVKDTECALEDGYDILKVKLGTTPAEDKERIIQFRNNPSDESWMKGDK
jgi:hypothetical protein